MAIDFLEDSFDSEEFENDSYECEEYDDDSYDCGEYDDDSYDCGEYDGDYYGCGGYEWTMEDSWYALTDGMYGEMPNNPMDYDLMMDAMGF